MARHHQRADHETDDELHAAARYVGEGVTAVVVCRKGAALDEKAVLDGLKDRLARYKQPKRVLFVDDLPRNTMGKVQKNILRETYAGLYES